MKIVNIICFLSALSLASANAVAQTCEELFGQPIHVPIASYLELREKINAPEIFLASLAKSASEIQPIQRLGQGYSGAVWKVNTPNGPMALKIMQRRGFSIDLNWIVIQDSIAQFQTAPRIRGMLSEAEMQQLFTNYADFFNQWYLRPEDFTIGVLMDLVTPNTLKTHSIYKPRLEVSPEQKHSLYVDVANQLKKLEQFGVAPSDIDAVVMDDGNGTTRLQLIDITFYELGRFDRETEASKLMSYIEYATEQGTKPGEKKSSRNFLQRLFRNKKSPPHQGRLLFILNSSAQLK